MRESALRSTYFESSFKSVKIFDVLGKVKTHSLINFWNTQPVTCDFRVTFGVLSRSACFYSNFIQNIPLDIYVSRRSN